MSRVTSQRRLLIKRFQSLVEGPMIVLGFVWLALLIIELVYQANPALETLGIAIWVIFIIDFLIKFFLAPEKISFFKANIITLISLVIPAFRILRLFRFFRLLRFSRSFRLVKVLGSLNRGMRALSATMERRAFGYVILLTFIVVFAGAAGMYAFEKDVDGGLNDYGTAVWWTSMIMTTLGSDYWPRTPEGRILCIALALFAFAVFGYITATIATYFIGRDAEDKTAELAGTRQISDLKKEIDALKQLVLKLSEKIDQRN